MLAPSGLTRNRRRVARAMPAFDPDELIGPLSSGPVGSERDVLLSGARNHAARVLRTVLLRGTDSRKAARILEVLEKNGASNPHELAALDLIEIRQILAESRLKVSDVVLTHLVIVARWLIRRLDEDGDFVLGQDISTDTLRDELRALKGVGAATADAILLFGLGRPAYPTDRASYRILARHGWIDLNAGYDEARETVEHAARGDLVVLERLAVRFEQLGSDFCHVRRPRCDVCPIRSSLPTGGPIGPDDWDG